MRERREHVPISSIMYMSSCVLYVNATTRGLHEYCCLSRLIKVFANLWTPK